MRKHPWQAWLAALGIGATVALVPALGHGGAAPPRAPHAGTADTPAGERWLRDVETRTLGPAHAAEHARMRELARDEAPADKSSGSASAAANEGDATAGAIQAAAVSTDPAQVGQWTPKFSIPGIAVHAVMLHTGKILYFTGTTAGRAFLLDPVTKTTRAVYPPKIPGGEDEPANIFCAGQSFLDDGTVIVMGGTVGRREGLKTIFLFDPVTETWRQGADMQHGRWYPTQVLLADGRTIVIDGLDERGEPHVNPQIESYTPDLDFVTLLSVRGQADHPPAGGLYPHLFQMPSGRVLVAGPTPSDSWFFRVSNIGALSWEDAPDPVRHTFGSGVLLPGTPSGSTRVALIGGVDRDALPDTGTSTPLPIVQTFDEANPSAGWATAPPLNHGRAHHNTVQLPDRSMVTVGGGYGILNGNRRAGDATIHRNIEIYDQASGQWTLGPAQDELRTYHSTALLLPDGRVLSAGDDGYGGSSNDTAEIYEPPYLFRGARPTIQSAPASIEYGQSFTVGTSADATKAVLMAPAAVTHANDMSQRNVPLTATAGPAGQLTVTAPATPELAPPTYYMLFVLNANGVPSVAKFVRLKFGAGNGPPNTVIDSGPPAETQSSAATFQFHTTEQGSTFRCKLDSGASAPCASPWPLSGLAAGPHTFEVTAIDAGGNADPSPATHTWTVNPAAPDTTPPQTSITYGPVSTTANTARFEFSASEPGGSFSCRLDAGAWGVCFSPTHYSGLTVAPHTFSVRATDPAGNVDPSPALWSWEVLPVTTALAEPPAASSLADSTAPAVNLRVQRKRGRVVLEVRCVTEACTATASGRILVSGAARSLKLRPASAQIAKGGRAKLQLRFPRKVSRTVRRAFRRRQKVRVRIAVTARDYAGNATIARRSFRLTR